MAFARELRDAAGDAPGPILVNGAIGPRGDGYVADALMTAAEAEAYHARAGRARSPPPAPTSSPRSR